MSPAYNNDYSRPFLDIFEASGVPAVLLDGFGYEFQLGFEWQRRCDCGASRRLGVQKGWWGLMIGTSEVSL